MRHAVGGSNRDLFTLEFVGYLLKFLLLTTKKTMIFSYHCFLNHSANKRVYFIKEANIISVMSENGSNLFLFGYFRLYINISNSFIFNSNFMSSLYIL